MTDCPCVAGNSYDECCGPYIAGKAAAPTVEALMRSRFTAFASGRLDYIEERTCASEMRETFDRDGAERVAEVVKWLSLQVLGRLAEARWMTRARWNSTRHTSRRD